MNAGPHCMVVMVGALLLFASGNVLAQCGCTGPECGVDGAGCQGTGSGSSSGSGTQSSNRGNNAAAAQYLIQGVGDILQQSIERREREAQEQARQYELQQFENARRQREEDARQIAMQRERQDRERQARERNGGFSADNPFVTSGSSGGSGDMPGSNAGDKVVVESADPEADHDGRSCAYFTCPAVRADGAGLNYHSKGSFVIFGRYAYECQNGYFRRRGPASAWLPAGEKNKAENLERGCQK